MTAETAVTLTAKLSNKHSVTITGSRIGVVCEWNPLPKRHGLTENEMQLYREARQTVIKQLFDRHGVKLLVVEI